MVTLYIIVISPKEFLKMGKPKKQTSKRKTGLRRSHLALELARRVNSSSPVKAYTTKRESAKKATVAK